MKSELLSDVNGSVKYWWLSLIIGLLALVVGVWVLRTPSVSLVALTYLFVVVFLLGGIFEIAFALSNTRMQGWGWNLAGGVLELFLGILLLSLPILVVTVMLIYLVGFWILFRSIWAIGEATELQRYGIPGWGWLLALAILSILFSFVFLLSPAFGGKFLIAFVGVALLCYGVFRIYLAYELLLLNREIKRCETKLP